MAETASWQFTHFTLLTQKNKKNICGSLELLIDTYINYCFL